MSYEIGDVFLTRWIDEAKNTSPGHWNHSAILSPSGVIESLSGRGVVANNFSGWITAINKESHCLHLRCIDPVAAQGAGNFAPIMVGGKYRAASSVFRNLPLWRIRRGLNCVSVVRISYKQVLGYDPKWTTPDGILNSPIFIKVGEYSGYSNS